MQLCVFPPDVLSAKLHVSIADLLCVAQQRFTSTKSYVHKVWFSDSIECADIDLVRRVQPAFN